MPRLLARAKIGQRPVFDAVLRIYIQVCISETIGARLSAVFADDRLTVGAILSRTTGFERRALVVNYVGGAGVN